MSPAARDVGAGANRRADSSEHDPFIIQDDTWSQVGRGRGYGLKAMNEAIEAREAHSVQAERIRTLEAEVASLKAWDAAKEPYELKPLGSGAIAYMLKPEARGTEPPHWLCPNCYTQGKKSFFQS